MTNWPICMKVNIIRSIYGLILHYQPKPPSSLFWEVEGISAQYTDMDDYLDTYFMDNLHHICSYIKVRPREVHTVWGER